MNNVAWGCVLAGLIGLPGTPTQRIPRATVYCLVGLGIALAVSFRSSGITEAVVLAAGVIGGAIAYTRTLLEGARFWFSAAVATCVGFGLIEIGVFAGVIGTVVLALPVIHIQRRKGPKHV